MDIRTLCLGVLTLHDSTGYEIKKMCQEGALCHFLEASFGSIYPALNKMCEEGLVTFRSESQEKRPDKKIYSITDKGRDVFQKSLLIDPLEDKYRSDFLFISLFAHLLDKEHMKRLIDQQIEYYRQRVKELKRSMSETQSPGAQFVSGFGEVTTKTIIDYLEQQRDLIEQASCLNNETEDA